jgi:hypothetical protein
LLLIPAPWTVAAPSGAFAREPLSVTVLLVIVRVTVPPKKKPTTPIAAAFLVGAVTVVVLPAMRRAVPSAE